MASVVDKQTRESLSELIARILDQLSVTAWLPSATLVAATALIVTTAQDDANVAIGLGSVADIGFAQLSLLVGAVVIATVITQAFEFGAVQLLEGYWGVGTIRRRIARAGMKHFERKRRSLDGRLRRAREGLVGQIRARLDPESGVTSAELDYIEAEILERPIATLPEVEESARDVDWRGAVDPDLLNLWLDLQEARRHFPDESHRILPTRLGNTLRSYEERISGTGRLGLRGYVHRVFHRLPTDMRYDHDLHRQRLDLYATLVFVFFTVSILGFAALVGADDRMGLVLPAACVALAALSYRAAIAAAHGYGNMLETIDDWVNRNPIEETSV